MAQENEAQYQAYSAASQTVRKTRQVVMLYDGAIRSVHQAKKAIEEDDVETRYNSLVKACNIVVGMQVSLDFDNGGEIAKLLYDYYAGIDMRIMSIHTSNSIEMCDTVIRHLSTMRDAWDEIDNNLDAGGKVVDSAKEEKSEEVEGEVKAEPTAEASEESAEKDASEAKPEAQKDIYQGSSYGDVMHQAPKMGIGKEKDIDLSDPNVAQPLEFAAAGMSISI